MINFFLEVRTCGVRLPRNAQRRQIRRAIWLISGIVRLPVDRRLLLMVLLLLLSLMMMVVVMLTRLRLSWAGGSRRSTHILAGRNRREIRPGHKPIMFIGT